MVRELIILNSSKNLTTPLNRGEVVEVKSNYCHWILFPRESEVRGAIVIDYDHGGTTFPLTLMKVRS